MKEELTEYLQANEISLDEAHLNKITELHNEKLKTIETEAFKKVEERVNGTLDGAAKAIYEGLGLEFNRGDKKHSEAITEGIQSYINASVSEKEAKIKELQELIEGTPDAGKLRAEIESQLKGETSKHIKTLEKTWQEKLAEKEIELEQFKIQSSFVSSMPAFDAEKISAIGQSNFDLIKGNAIREIMKDYEFRHDNGAYIPHRNMVDHELAEILKNHPSLKPFVSDPHQQKGNGAHPGEGKHNTPKDPEKYAQQVREELIASGKKVGTPEFAIEFTKRMREY